MGKNYKHYKPDSCEEKCPDPCGCPVKLGCTCVTIEQDTVNLGKAGTNLCTLIDKLDGLLTEILSQTGVDVINTIVNEYLDENLCDLVTECSNTGCLNPPTLESINYNCETTQFDFVANNYSLITVTIVRDDLPNPVEIAIQLNENILLDPLDITKVTVYSNQGCPALEVPVSLACECLNPIINPDFGYDCETGTIYINTAGVQAIDIKGIGVFEDGDPVQLDDGGYVIDLIFEEEGCPPLSTSLTVFCPPDPLFLLINTQQVVCVGDMVQVSGTYTTNTTLPLNLSGVSGLTNVSVNGGSYSFQFPSPAVATTYVVTMSNAEVSADITVDAPVCVDFITNPELLYDCDTDEFTITGDNIDSVIIHLPPEQGGDTNVVDGQVLDVWNGTYDLTFLPTDPEAPQVTIPGGLVVDCVCAELEFNFAPPAILTECEPECTRIVRVNVTHTEEFEIELVFINALNEQVVLGTQIVPAPVNPPPNNVTTVSMNVECDIAGTLFFRDANCPESVSGTIMLQFPDCDDPAVISP